MTNLRFFKTIACFVLFASFFLSARGEKHFLTNTNYRINVEKQFEKQKKLAVSRNKQLFSVFDQKLSLEEKEALTFLYAYMPLSDLADYNGDFFLKNVRATFKAKETFSWSSKIPEDIFRHFVMPMRINNETLDTARVVFFAELKNRIKKLSLKDAVLEVNHWCHEKVVYRSTDGRTSSPLNCVRTAFGRCGEESTFVTTALRSVGIPARQCYTPRWAHSDDNHAWVEVWVDGKWYFIGACEPEPDLNIGWFAEPSKRAMLVNTNVFGDYRGPEEVLEKTEYFTKINVLANYTKTKKVHVKIVNEANQPVVGAEVEFCLYNYAEFYPLSKKYADKNGVCPFVTGLGDLLVWTNYKGKFGFQKLTVSQTDTMTLVLGDNSKYRKPVNYDLVPPVEVKIDLNLSAEAIAANAKRLVQEDVIRNNYTATFIDSISASAIAKKLQLNNDSVCYVLAKSYGNWKAIVQFLESKSKYNAWKLPLLYAASDKDLRDIALSSLLDHLNYSFNYAEQINAKDKADFVKYVLNHRINIEMSSSYKHYFQTVFTPDFISETRRNVDFLVKWIVDNIKINEKANYYNVSISPKGVYELKLADENSRNIFFVAVCRSFGIPARIETATKQPQYLMNSKWENAVFEKSETKHLDMGFVVLQNITKVKDFVPSYSIHYSLAFYKNGKYQTLDYEESSLLNKFPCKLELAVGQYMLVTGNRQRNGSVLNTISFFEVAKGQTLNVNIALREVNEEIVVHGNIPMTNKVVLENGSVQTLSSLASEKGVVLAWIDPEKEPTKHILVEMQDLKLKFQNWGGTIALLMPDKNVLASFKPERLKNLPAQCVTAVDEQLGLLKLLESTTKLSLQSKLPILLYLTESGDILFISSGYAIGTVEQLEKAISKHTESLKSCVKK